MELAQKIKKMAESHLADPSHFVVDVLVSKYKPTKVTVQLDGDNGIGIDHCAELSHKLSDELETVDLIEGAYNLEVGTPGVDQPLKLTRQYRKNIGREVKVHLTDKSTIRGKLVSVDEEKIVVQEGVEKNVPTRRQERDFRGSEIPFTDIEKTIVIVSFK